MFTDPQSVTLAGVLTSLPKVNTKDSGAVYSSPDGTLTLEISHSKTRGRLRRLVKLTRKKIAADPLMAGVSRYSTGSVHVVLDFPEVDFTTVEQQDLMTALDGWTSVPANVTKIIGGES